MKYINKRIIKHLKQHYTTIKVIPHTGLFNHKCMYNAVQAAYDNPLFTVEEVIAFDKDQEPFLHYINKDITTGIYHETTLGYMANHYNYYLLKSIHSNKYESIGDVFENTLDEWKLRHTNILERLIFNIKRIL